jgi:hypothetical protein
MKTSTYLLSYVAQFLEYVSDKSCQAVFLNRRAAARYRALESIIPGRENLSF